MTILYRYDKDGCFTSEMTAQTRPNGEEILDVLGATLLPPPTAPDKQTAVFDGDAWHVRPDHRQKKDERGCTMDGSGTPYWLPGDTWQSQPRYMTTIGELPEEALLEAPDKPLSEVKREKRACIEAAYQSALTATLTMPAQSPSQTDVALEAALFAVDDAEGLAFVKQNLAAQKDALLAAVDASSTAAEVEAVQAFFSV